MSRPHAFIALYTGATVAEARIVAASADPDLVALVAEKMLPAQEEDTAPLPAPHRDEISPSVVLRSLHEERPQ